MSGKFSLGVDGCRAGWLLCQLTQNDAPKFWVAKHLIQEKTLFQTASAVFVDMPFGLSSQGERTCDQLARKMLGKRRATIFMTPCRQAVYAANYQQACRVNQAICGKKISIQAWNLIPKIRQLDQFLRENPALTVRFFESHPELCFAWLNEGQILQSSKKTVEGQHQRLRLLAKKLAITHHTLQNWRQKIGKSRVQMDDLLDALVLAVCAAQPEGLRTFVPTKVELDDFGLRMNIVCLSNV